MPSTAFVRNCWGESHGIFDEQIRVAIATNDTILDLILRSLSDDPPEDPED